MILRWRSLTFTSSAVSVVQSTVTPFAVHARDQIEASLLVDSVLISNPVHRSVPISWFAPHQALHERESIWSKLKVGVAGKIS